MLKREEALREVRQMLSLDPWIQMMENIVKREDFLSKIKGDHTFQSNFDTVGSYPMMAFGESPQSSPPRDWSEFVKKTL